LASKLAPTAVRHDAKDSIAAGSTRMAYGYTQVPGEITGVRRHPWYQEARTTRHRRWFVVNSPVIAAGGCPCRLVGVVTQAGPTAPWSVSSDHDRVGGDDRRHRWSDRPPAADRAGRRLRSPGIPVSSPWPNGDLVVTAASRSLGCSRSTHGPDRARDGWVIARSRHRADRAAHAVLQHDSLLCRRAGAEKRFGKQRAGTP